MTVKLNHKNMKTVELKEKIHQHLSLWEQQHIKHKFDMLLLV